VHNLLLAQTLASMFLLLGPMVIDQLQFGIDRSASTDFLFGKLHISSAHYACVVGPSNCVYLLMIFFRNIEVRKK
jgi:hypothetical protein